jgi:hypothetical protein
VIHRFYRLPSLGMFVRMLDTQIAATGESPSLGCRHSDGALSASSAREAARVAFEARAADLETELG